MLTETFIFFDVFKLGSSAFYELLQLFLICYLFGSLNSEVGNTLESSICNVTLICSIIIF